MHTAFTHRLLGLLLTSMAVLMIGSTGNGKSTLGNYLLDPNDDHLYRNQTFSTAKDSKPHTQEVKSGFVKVKKGSTPMPLTIIDTPGLNESGEKDLIHMTSLVQSIKDIGKIQACLLVVKFNSKLDAQFKATVEYYSRLLPSLFEKNVVIVMTAFAMDSRSTKLREKQGIDVEKVKEDAVKEVKASGRLWYTPTLFTIDCLPVEEEEEKVNLKIRQSLLEFICSQRPVSVNNLRVAKQDYLMQQDAQQVAHLEGEIQGYNAKLKKKKVKAIIALSGVEENETKITKAITDRRSLKEELREKNTDDPFTLDEWSVNVSGKFLRSIKKEFHLESEWKITSVEKWKNSEDVEWKDCEEHDYWVKGTVVGHFMRGVTASVKIETSRKLRFENEIAQLKIKIADIEKQEKDLRTRLDEIKEENKQYREEIDELEEYITHRQTRIVALRKPYMSIEEALKRAKDIGSK